MLLFDGFHQRTALLKLAQRCGVKPNPLASWFWGGKRFATINPLLGFLVARQGRQNDTKVIYPDGKRVDESHFRMVFSELVEIICFGLALVKWNVPSEADAIIKVVETLVLVNIAYRDTIEDTEIVGAQVVGACPSHFE